MMIKKLTALVILFSALLLLTPVLAVSWTPYDECPWPRAEFKMSYFESIESGTWFEAKEYDKNKRQNYTGTLVREHKRKEAVYLLMDKYVRGGNPKWYMIIAVVERCFPIPVVHLSDLITVGSEKELEDYLNDRKTFKVEGFDAFSLKTVILPRRGETVKAWVHGQQVTSEDSVLYHILNKIVDSWKEKGGGKIK